MLANKRHYLALCICRGGLSDYNDIKSMLVAALFTEGSPIAITTVWPDVPFNFPLSRITK